jgi:hypothetical protein
MLPEEDVFLICHYRGAPYWEGLGLGLGLELELEVAVAVVRSGDAYEFKLDYGQWEKLEGLDNFGRIGNVISQTTEVNPRRFLK